MVDWAEKWRQMAMFESQQGIRRTRLACHRCPWEANLANLYSCRACGDSLKVVYPQGSDPLNSFSEKSGLWRYQHVLPVMTDEEPITLGEGDTPLLVGRGLEPSGNLFLKNETGNPTASFKDRPVAVAATVARQFGLSGLVCASTGNTAVAVAAYGAQGDIPAVCLVPEATPSAKLTQIEAVGARTIRVKGTYSDAYFLARTAAERYGWANLTSTYINPYMLEGDKTVAFEIFEQLDRVVPDWIIVPVGAGPLLAAIYKGFEELGETKTSQSKGPRMVAVQAAGCAPIVRAFRSGVEEVTAWEEAVETGSSSIGDPLRGYPADGSRTLAIVRDSGGTAVAVSERDIHAGMIELARSEGLFVEPGAAATIGAHRRLVSEGLIRPADTTTLLLTGHGLKDPEAFRVAAAEHGIQQAPVIAAGDEAALGEILGDSSSEQNWEMGRPK
jgi:threonine synthase